MKAIISKNISRMIIVGLAFVCLMLIGAFGIRAPNQDGERLSEEKILLLREKYPLHGVSLPFGVDMVQPTLETMISRVDTFVYGTVVGDVSTYAKNIPTGYAALDEKREANGMSNEVIFQEYTIRIIRDTENQYKNGDIIKIKANAIFDGYHPSLKDGMKMVIPVVKDVKEENRFDYNVVGMYYVTEEGYALSAYPENTLSRKSLNGVKVEELLKQLKK